MWLLVRIPMLFLEHKRWIMKGRNRNESKRGRKKEVEKKQLVLKTVKLVSLTDVKSFTAHLHMTAPLTAMCVCDIRRYMNIRV